MRTKLQHHGVWVPIKRPSPPLALNLKSDGRLHVNSRGFDNMLKNCDEDHEEDLQCLKKLLASNVRMYVADTGKTSDGSPQVRLKSLKLENQSRNAKKTKTNTEEYAAVQEAFHKGVEELQALTPDKLLKKGFTVTIPIPEKETHKSFLLNNRGGLRLGNLTKEGYEAAIRDTFEKSSPEVFSFFKSQLDGDQSKMLLWLRYVCCLDAVEEVGTESVVLHFCCDSSRRVSYGVRKVLPTRVDPQQPQEHARDLFSTNRIQVTLPYNGGDGKIVVSPQGRLLSWSAKPFRHLIVATGKIGAGGKAKTETLQKVVGSLSDNKLKGWMVGEFFIAKAEKKGENELVVDLELDRQRSSDIQLLAERIPAELQSVGLKNLLRKHREEQPEIKTGSSIKPKKAEEEAAPSTPQKKKEKTSGKKKEKTPKAPSADASGGEHEL